MRPAHVKAVRDLIRLAYECSLDGRQWPHFLASFSKTLDGARILLGAQDIGVRNGHVSVVHEIDPFWMKRYREYYAGIDVRVRNSRHLWKPGATIRSEAVIADAALRKTEFYNDYMRPQRLFYSVAAILSREDSATSLIDIGHTGGRPVLEAELGLLRELAPHLRTALRLHHRIAGLETRLDSATGALDRLPQALIVTDSSARILHLNRRAEALLKSASGLSAGADGLRAGSSRQTARLREFIARTASTIAGNGQHPGGVLRVPRAGHLPLKLQIAPLASSPVRAGRRPTVAIFIAEPEQAATPDPILLAALLELSPAEARLTAAIARGETIQRFAMNAGMSLNSARTLLKRAFAKTGVSRQADLVRLALTCAVGSDSSSTTTPRRSPNR